MATHYHPTPEDEDHAKWLLRGIGLTLDDVDRHRFLELVAQLNQSDNYYVSRRAWVVIERMMDDAKKRKEKSS